MSPPTAHPTTSASGASAGRVTLLERALADAMPPARSTVLDAFKLARRRFLEGQRIDMSMLARELEINRVTLYRWVGSRERLLAEIIWSLWSRTMQGERDRATGAGAERVVQVITGSLEAVISHRGWRRQLTDEGELIMRLLTRGDAGVQPRIIAAYRELLAEEASAGRLELSANLDELAYALVRISESYVYRELITGDPPDAAGAGQLLRLLLR
jgi:AcrR family transcriptional regulator